MRASDRSHPCAPRRWNVLFAEKRRQGPLAGLVALSLLIGGCGGDPNHRAPIQGTVLVDGEPLESGSIVFVPTGKTRGPEAACRVAKGQFSLSRREGPLVGRHKVRIFADQTLAYALDDPRDYAQKAPRRSPRNPIPEQYNERTVLEAPVAADQPNHFQFDLKRRQDGVRFADR